MLAIESGPGQLARYRWARLPIKERTDAPDPPCLPLIDHLKGLCRSKPQIRPQAQGAVEACGSEEARASRGGCCQGTNSGQDQSRSRGAALADGKGESSAGGMCGSSMGTGPGIAVPHGWLRLYNCSSRSPISVTVLFSVGARNRSQEQVLILRLESRKSSSLVKLVFPIIILGRKANVMNGAKFV